MVYTLSINLTELAEKDMKPTRLFALIILCAFSLAACDKGLRGLSNQELVAKNDACVMGNPTAPGKVTACENIKKECERRRKDGNYAC